MPLQIRRGTDAERTAMTQPLAAGELIFVTNTNRLYIGNGTTNGGVPVTDYTDEQARDAVAPMLVTGTHSAISFVYDDALDKVNATVNLSDYQGVIKAAAFNGSVVANDSSLLIDGNTGKFNLSGSVGTDIIPDTDLAYDLGSPTFRFRDLYLSGSSIKLGAATITATGTAVNLPAGSTIGGSAIGIPGGDLNVNIVADDSTVIVNTTTEVVTAQGGFVGNVTGNINGVVTGTAGSSLVGNVTGNVTGNINGVVTGTAGSSLVGNVTGNVTGNVNGVVTGTAGSSLVGNVTGNVNGVVTGTAGSSLVGNVTGNVTGNSNGFHTGDVKGSVFGDDSSIIVDAVDSAIIIKSLTLTDGFSPNVVVSNSGGDLFIGSTVNPSAVVFSVDSTSTPIIVQGVTAGSFGNQPVIAVAAMRGSLTTPAVVQNGDSVGLLSFSPYTGGAGGFGYASGGFVGAIVNDAGTLASAAEVACDIILVSATDVAAGNYTLIAKGGYLSAPFIGYRSGYGGTNTQGAGSGKATGVTLDKVTGEITLNAASLAANTNVSFTLTNSKISQYAHILVSHISGGTLGAYNVTAIASSGSAVITVRNLTSGALAEAIVIKYSILSSAIA